MNSITNKPFFVALQLLHSDQPESADQLKELMLSSSAPDTLQLKLQHQRKMEASKVGILSNSGSKIVNQSTKRSNAKTTLITQ